MWLVADEKVLSCFLQRVFSSWQKKGGHLWPSVYYIAVACMFTSRWYSCSIRSRSASASSGLLNVVTTLYLIVRPRLR